MLTKHQIKWAGILNAIFCISFAITIIAFIGYMIITIEAVDSAATSAAASHAQRTANSITKTDIPAHRSFRQASRNASRARMQEIRVEAIPLVALDGPALYASYVDEIVANYYPDLNADYIKAMIYHESRYDPSAVNQNSGVMGLMQISPKWHLERARSLGVTDLLDPYGNILVGCDLLNELTQQYDFQYAVNFFAGGYAYANDYCNSPSPYILAVQSFITQMQCGEIVL